MTKGGSMKRLLLLGAALAALAGCRTAEKPQAAAKPEERSRWSLPRMFTTDDFWRKGEMGDVSDR